MLPAKRVMQDMPAYAEADGREKLAQKNARIMNVGSAPKTPTPMPGATEEAEMSAANEQLRSRMDRIVGANNKS